MRLAYFKGCFGAIISAIFIVSTSAQAQQCTLPKGFALVEGQNQYNKLANLNKTDALLINLWSSWCPPCIKELPILDTWAEKYPLSISIINVLDREESSLNTFNKLNIEHLNYEVNNDKNILRKLELKGLPATILFDNEKIWLNIGNISKHETQLEQWLECLYDKETQN